MVRGISKQVIVVSGNHTDCFESAFFILKGEFLREGISEKELLRQARWALDDVGAPAKRNPGWGKTLWGFGGFVLSCCIWLLVLLL